MSTTDRTTLAKGAAGLTAGLAAAVTLVLVLAVNGQDSMARGAATGAGVVLVLFCLTVIRALRDPSRLTSAERSLVGQADERDTRLAERSFALTGLLAIPATSVATVALALGAPVAPVMAVLIWLLVVTAVVSGVVLARRG
ncbi:hypothetical protein IGS67_10815 [Flavimobilis sp. GY10621]|uniref:Integral membrane protein n=1 Tax=Flavimobilis rhizosphaerae TaxID=2775421 RepID=A0ABR9DS41_9MICO|nr:hypothetical protein [Flavimobilis rhizosphaerae]MBD9699978.1 hypothetical protein [Flavimobilis rhizosphaerae]